MATGSLRAENIVYYVATNGSDSWAGKSAEPNKAKTDGPFATITKARNAVRKLKGGEGLKGPVTVMLRGGTYFIEKEISFSPKDSGSKACPVTYQAYKNEKPIISGGKLIKGWKKLSRIQDPASSIQLWQADIPEVVSEGWYFNQLFVNGERRVRARTPNFGEYFRTAGPAAGENNPLSKKSFKFNKGDIKEWDDIKDAVVVVFHAWTSSRHSISSVDTGSCVVKFKYPASWPFGWFGCAEKKQRYYVENIFEALDSPGEWYLNRSTGVLYYYPLPGEDMKKAEVFGPVVKGLVNFNGKPENSEFVEYINFKGISFRHCDWSVTQRDMAADCQSSVIGFGAAIKGKGVRHCNIENCEVAHAGEYGIWLGIGSQDNRIYQCHIYDLGGGGVRIGDTWQGNGDSTAACRNTVDNNFIHDGGNVFHAGMGVWVGRSSYNAITHNDICDFYQTGISAGWSWGFDPSTAHDNAIEYNHIHHLGFGVTNDMGGIYTLGMSPGTTERYNLIHDINCYQNGYGGWGIYPDEGSTGIVIENNIVYNTSKPAFFIHYGRELTVRNNIFALSEAEGISTGRKDKQSTSSYSNNIVYTIKNDLYNGTDDFTSDYNLFWDPSGAQVKIRGKSFEEWQEKGQDKNSIVADPMFVDAKNYDFRLKPGSPAEKIGFKPIDAGKIGLYGNKEWTGLPAEATHRKMEVSKPLPPEPVEDDFEGAKAGDVPYSGSLAITQGKKASIAVTGETAASGKHSLKFTDAPGLANIWEPHIYWNINYKGKVKFSCDLMNSAEEPAEFYIEFRDWRQNPYSVGPTFWVHSDGRFDASGGQIASVTPGKWFRVEIDFEAGEKTPKEYRLKLTEAGGQPQVFGLQFGSQAFEVLTWFGISSLSDKRTVFYVDNIKLEPVK